MYMFVTEVLQKSKYRPSRPLDCRLRQTANLKKFFCNKIKIMNREIFEPYGLL